MNDETNCVSLSETLSGPDQGRFPAVPYTPPPPGVPPAPTTPSPSHARAYAYLRVSTAGQVEGDGLERQRAAIAEYASARGLLLAGEFRDEGVSGTRELADRPGLGELVALLERGDTVLVERADRLARDLVVSEMILRELRGLQVAVLDCSSGQNLAGDASDDPSRALIRQVLAAVAQYEKGVLVHRMRAARERIRRATGRCEGRKPYGARAGEETVIEVARELRGTGMDLADVAGELNRRGLLTRMGCAWTRSRVGVVLRRSG